MKLVWKAQGKHGKGTDDRLDAELVGSVCIGF
jgi:hypothetical protein